MNFQVASFPFSRKRVLALRSKSGRLAVRTFLIAFIVTGVMMAPRPERAQDCNIQSGCRTPSKVDIAFILDRSGSVGTRGQTWNLMVEGLLRALSDPTVIPRDGSTAVCVVAFNGAANLVVPLTDINVAGDAAKVANQVQTLKCSGDIHSQVFPCPFGETSFVSGILSAGNNLSQVRSAIPKPGARQVLVLVSDGSTSPADLSQATKLAEQTRTDARLSGVELVFDAFMMGVDPKSAEFPQNKAALDSIVTPQFPKFTAGTTTVVNPGACNLEGASFTSDDCNRQANEFVEDTRKILRSDIPSLSLLVNLEADTTPGAAQSKAGLSLRQAIEAANCNGGSTTIAFNTSLMGKTIHPAIPLPALSAPDILISGCDSGQTGCVPLVTIDGGGQLADGLLIRSNHDVVRGLRVINFTHAGIVVAPACAADNTGRNLIEKNVLENNPTGIVVFDQKSAPRDGFNEENTISQNNISRTPSATGAPPSALIDLGGDGPTANDAGDADAGPNTLLNFPDSLNVFSSGSGTVTITGQVSGPTVAGATIEFYAITSSHIDAGKVVIDGVTFLAQTAAGNCAVGGVTGSSCRFTATGVSASPSGNYTATVTDSLGNSSEFMFRSDGKPAAGPDASLPPAVDFGTVTLNSTPQSQQVNVVNNGNGPLVISGCSLGRCAPNDPDNTGRFAVSGCPSPTTQINPGEQVTITITFATDTCGPAKACLVLAANDLLHAPLTTMLTGQVGSGPNPAVVLQGDVSSAFGPVSPKGRRRGLKKLIKKEPFHSFTISNTGCNAFNLAFVSIKRDTDVPKCISSANADDSGLFVATQLKSGIETPVLFDTTTGAIQVSPGDILTFRVRFNPAVPLVVNKTCPDGKLTADEVLPDEIRSTMRLSATAGNVTTTLLVPLTGRVTKDLRLIDPTDPSQLPMVALCRSGNDFIVQFSVYDANQNVDHADFQFLDSAGRAVGQVIQVTALDQAIAAKNLATGQSFTIVQRFSGANDNSQVTTVQLTVFDKDGSSDAATSAPINAGCSGVTAQSLGGANAVLNLPSVPLHGKGGSKHHR
jgi:hypothetical protein